MHLILLIKIVALYMQVIIVKIRFQDIKNLWIFLYPGWSWICLIKVSINCLNNIKVGVEFKTEIGLRPGIKRVQNLE